MQNGSKYSTRTLEINIFMPVVQRILLRIMRNVGQEMVCRNYRGQDINSPSGVELMLKAKGKLIF
jgi:hypothetical protein